MPEFQRFDPASCGFPRPRAPFLPALRWGDLSFGSGDTIDPSLLNGPGVHHFSRGRYALRSAYRLAGVGPSGALLVPAYHCRTMLDPALALGAQIYFYQTGADLAPDTASIRALIATCATPPKALIVPHYFGVEQQVGLMQELAALCARHGITLVEDCSHAWQVAVQRAGGALDGRVIVASPYKFFGCEDGGVLWTSADARIPASASASVIDEVKALKNAWSRSRPAVLHDIPIPEAGHRGATIRENGDAPSHMYQRAIEERNSLALSRWTMRHTRLEPLIARRREHYQQWLHAVADLQHARPLYPELPDACVPYMFPLEIDMPDPHFFQLKQAGLPIWRWDDMAVTQCATANRYRLHLLHLPCHQDLNSAQMDWMTSIVKKVLA